MPVRFILKRMQHSSVDICSSDILLLFPFLKDGLLSVSTPTILNFDRYSIPFFTSATVCMTIILPGKLSVSRPATSSFDIFILSFVGAVSLRKPSLSPVSVAAAAFVSVAVFSVPAIAFFFIFPIKSFSIIFIVIIMRLVIFILVGHVAERM